MLFHCCVHVTLWRPSVSVFMTLKVKECYFVHALLWQVNERHTLPPTIRLVFGNTFFACIRARACPEWKRSKIPSA